MSVTRPERSDDANGQLLRRLGTRVRTLRARRGMSRRTLADASGVSERYLAQLEVGKGNPSILKLQAVAHAMDVALDDLVDAREDLSTEYQLLRERIRHAERAHLEQCLDALTNVPTSQSRNHLALVGLRGAGKSTLGAALARRLRLPFIELVQEIERHAGMAVAEIFSLGGQTTYRRLEQEALTQVCQRHTSAVIAVGGSLVSEPGTFEILLAHCITIWVKAESRQHMERVLAQGDHRPMANHRNAMADLKRILTERESLYRRADGIVDTSDDSVAESVGTVLKLEVARHLAANTPF